MREGFIIQTLLVAFAISLFAIAFVSLVRRKMSEVVVIPWGLEALVFVILGFVIRPDGWKSYISPRGLGLIIVMAICATYALYFFSIKITEMLKKNNELAIQVSLLNTEVEELRKKMEELEEINSDNEEDTVRN